MRSLLGVLNVVGTLLAWFALYFILPIITGLFYGEWLALRGFIIGGVISAVLGVTLQLLTRRYRQDLKPRDAFLLVSGGWLTVAAVATTPLLMDVHGLSYTRAYFETMSGLSTTGATVLRGLDQLPHCLNLWRHALSWLGGMGIIVFGVAILPLLGIGGMHFYRAGAPGGVKETKFAPRITETARIAEHRVCRPDRGMRAVALGGRHVPVRCGLSCHAPPWRSAASAPMTPTSPIFTRR